MIKYTAAEFDVIANYLRDGAMPRSIAQRIARIHDLDEDAERNLASAAGAIYRNDFWKDYLQDGEEWTRPDDVPVAE